MRRKKQTQTRGPALGPATGCGRTGHRLPRAVLCARLHRYGESRPPASRPSGRGCRSQHRRGQVLDDALRFFLPAPNLSDDVDMAKMNTSDLSNMLQDAAERQLVASLVPELTQEADAVAVEAKSRRSRASQ